ncbi:ROK family protein [Microbacterium sp. 179-I 3D4 NHS]|uniref:ROK family protein n=1 Tax=Microbacterium sp. 179-I 3D4 NHS TaxID=3142381 RepID=UPI00399F327D
MTDFSNLTSAGGILTLVRDGYASSRAEISRLTGLAPSTVTLRIDELITHGYLTESGEGRSRGGRRPRTLTVADAQRYVAGVDLGARHATLVLCDTAGEPLARKRIATDISRPPEAVLRGMHEEILSMGAEFPERELAGIGLSLPGPVGSPDGRVISPSRMPGWNGIDAAAILRGISGVPVIAENDANAMAWGEYVVGGRRSPYMIVVKAGSSIGVGIIADGRLHRGARGLAGDVSHTAVADGPKTLCSCGRFGCLDAVAGGRAIVAALAADGLPVEDVSDVAEYARDAHPLAARLLREAGLRTGAVVATLVGFFNPDRVVIGGALSAAEAFVAGVRSSVYDLCLPMSTSGLELVESTAGWEGGARGAAVLMLAELLDPAAVDRRVRELR